MLRMMLTTITKNKKKKQIIYILIRNMHSGSSGSQVIYKSEEQKDVPISNLNTTTSSNEVKDDGLLNGIIGNYDKMLEDISESEENENVTDVSDTVINYDDPSYLVNIIDRPNRPYENRAKLLGEVSENIKTNKTTINNLQQQNSGIADKLNESLENQKKNVSAWGALRKELDNSMAKTGAMIGCGMIFLYGLWYFKNSIISGLFKKSIGSSIKSGIEGGVKKIMTESEFQSGIEECFSSIPDKVGEKVAKSVSNANFDIWNATIGDIITILNNNPVFLVPISTLCVYLICRRKI